VKRPNNQSLRLAVQYAELLLLREEQAWSCVPTASADAPVQATITNRSHRLKHGPALGLGGRAQWTVTVQAARAGTRPAKATGHSRGRFRNSSPDLAWNLQSDQTSLGGLPYRGIALLLAVPYLRSARLPSRPAFFVYASGFRWSARLGPERQLTLRHA